MQENINIKYTPEDIDRIYAERVTISTKQADLKPGVVCEWAFE